MKINEMSTDKHKLIAIIKHDEGLFMALTHEKTDVKPILNPLELGQLFQKNPQSIFIFASAKENLEKLDFWPKNLICIKSMIKLSLKPISNDFDIIFKQNPFAVFYELYNKCNEISVLDLCHLEFQIIPIIIKMQRAGLPFNKNIWEKELLTIQSKFEKIKMDLQKYIQIDRGFELFNAPSKMDDRIIKEGLEKILKKKLINVSQKNLKDIDHEAVKLVLEYRELEHLIKNFGPSFLSGIDGDRLRGIFDPLGTSSGRMSCQRINLQSLPKSPKFQKAISPRHGAHLNHFDYNGFELRILAALSDDKSMLNIFNDGLDVHSEVAKKIFQTEVSKSKNIHLREHAKIINFGIVYGIKEEALARELNMPVFRAKALLDGYFKRFFKVKEFLLALEEKASKYGFVNTRLGRRIKFPKILDAHNLRVARNMPIQGTGADIVKLAICFVQNKIEEKKLDARLVNCVHDELVIESAFAIKEELCFIVKKAMEDAFLTVLPGVKPEVSVKS